MERGNNTNRPGSEDGWDNNESFVPGGLPPPQGSWSRRGKKKHQGHFADTSESPNNSKKDGATADRAAPGSRVIIRLKQHELVPLKNRDARAAGSTRWLQKGRNTDISVRLCNFRFQACAERELTGLLNIAHQEVDYENNVFFFPYCFLGVWGFEILTRHNIIDKIVGLGCYFHVWSLPGYE